MKRIFLVLFTIGCCHVFAQSSLKKANTLVGEFRYLEAATLYQNILTADPSNTMALQNIVLCYNKLNDYARSEEWLARLCNTPSVDVRYFRMYAESLAANDKHTEAVKWFKKYLETVPDAAVLNKVKGLEQKATYYADSSFIRINPVSFNSGSADFSPAYFGSGIIFCSANNSKSARKYAWDNSSFIDLFYIEKGSQTPVDLGRPVNSALHEGPASLSTTGDTLFFTRNSAQKILKGNEKDVVKLMICYTVRKDGAWGKVLSFPLNNNGYSTGHPAVYKNKIYFVSDMPGGFGGTDIYVTTLENGRWTAPQNLGAAINTSGNEMFPFVSDNADLYFASNTLPGLGGLDVFMAKIKDGKLAVPTNVGAPINSSRDDFGMIVKGSSGFLSSNRKGNDDLYSINIEKSRSLNIVASNNGQPVSDFSIRIVGSEHETNQTVRSIFTDSFHADEEYKIVCTKIGYKEKEITLRKADLAMLRDGSTLAMELERLPKKVKVSLQTADHKQIAFGNIEVKSEGNSSVIFDSGKDGLLQLELDQNIPVEIVGSRVNFKSTTVSLTSEQIQALQEGSVIPVVLTIPPTLFEKNEIGQVIELDIKYDVNKFNIRKDAARELDKLVVYLKRNPTVKVELGSHTDVRGADASNMKLSQKRAAAAAEFIVSKGISSARIIPVGYGKNDPKIINAVTEEEHQQNRRTTVKIVGL